MSPPPSHIRLVAPGTDHEDLLGLHLAVHGMNLGVRQVPPPRAAFRLASSPPSTQEWKGGMKRQLRGKKEIGKMRAAQWGLIVSDTKEKNRQIPDGAGGRHRSCIRRIKTNKSIDRAVRNSCAEMPRNTRVCFSFTLLIIYTCTW